LTRPERVALIDRAAADLPLAAQADVLGISRASLFYQPIPPSSEDVAIKHRIDARSTECPFYGSRRITAQLRREEVLINRKTVQRSMREMGIAGIGPRPKLSHRKLSSEPMKPRSSIPLLLAQAPYQLTCWDRPQPRG
jgi:putative transposase